MTPADRRRAIVDAATTLFATCPWETVTIADVLAAARLSKGGFYHHFASKEDLLVAVVQRIVQEGLDEAVAAPAAAGGDAVARLSAFLQTSAEWQLRRAAELKSVAEIVRRPRNDMVFNRLFLETSQAALPVLRDLIEHGIAERRFDPADTALAAEILLGFARERQAVFFAALEALRAGDRDRGAALIADRLDREARTCERLLGLPPGSLALTGPILEHAHVLGTTCPAAPQEAQTGSRRPSGR